MSKKDKCLSRESYSCWAQAEHITELHSPQSIYQGKFIPSLRAGQVLS